MVKRTVEEILADLQRVLKEIETAKSDARDLAEELARAI